jgi:hypothetical protein
MVNNNWVFPEDEGTGAYSPGSGDYSDAANFGAAFYAIGFTDCVREGMGFTLDAGTPALDVAEGIAVVTQSAATATNSNESRVKVAYAVHYTGETGIALTDSDVNYVYLVLDLNTGDSPSVVVNITDADPAGSGEVSLKIGEVNTSDDTTTELNRGPLDGLTGEAASPQIPKSHGNEAHNVDFVQSTDTATISVGSTEPSSPTDGDVWFDTS